MIDGEWWRLAWVVKSNEGWTSAWTKLLPLSTIKGAMVHAALGIYLTARFT